MGAKGFTTNLKELRISKYNTRKEIWLQVVSNMKLEYPNRPTPTFRTYESWEANERGMSKEALNVITKYIYPSLEVMK